MALINCPRCQKQISNQIENCPHCGFSFQENNNYADQGRKIYRRRVVAATAIIVLVLSFVIYLYIVIDVL